MIQQLSSQLVLLTTYNHHVASLLADHCGLYDPLGLAHIVEDAILADAHLPFPCPIRAKPLAVARLHVRLVDELLVDSIEDGLALALLERRNIIQSRGCELDLEVRHNGERLAHVSAGWAASTSRPASQASARAWSHGRDGGEGPGGGHVAEQIQGGGLGGGEAHAPRHRLDGMMADIG